MKIKIRKFGFNDIENKVKWINDDKINKYLHYDLPLEVEKTRIWFENNKDNTNRYDGVILADDIPAGLIGLLNIEEEKAEYYIALGEEKYFGKNIANEATKLILDYARELNLDLVYAYAEIDNTASIKLMEKNGFVVKDLLKKSVKNRDKLVDRYYLENYLN